MKKSASSELLNGHRTETLSSGVVVRISPFPARLWDKITQKSEKLYPAPVPPKKIITVLGGTEEVDNLTDPDYVAKKDEIDQARKEYFGNLIGEAVLDLCIEVDLAQYAVELKRLEKYADEAPADPNGRKLFFLENYALRGRADYERVTTLAATLMAVGDDEVAERLNSFQDNLARPTAAETSSPGPESEKPLAVEQPQAGA